ncbi:MAG: asparagine synthase B [Planctomycetota bacterium]|jgi:asparagine synthase (glutamine-hydrolysing)
MCSILALLDLKAGDAESLRPSALQLSARQRHRGPDWSGVWSSDHALLVHERLAIVDPAGGAQPIVSADGRHGLAVNGEIYNHRELREELAADYAFQTGSDCEVILPLVLNHGPESLKRLNGMFAFALCDRDTGRYVIARDPIGVIPLYYGHDEQDRLVVASEMKSLSGHCATIKCFPPGHYWDGSTPEPVPYFESTWDDFEAVSGSSIGPDELREGLIASVKRHLMGDVPYGVLLSGGLDSSIVAAIAAKLAAKRVDEDDQTDAWWPRLHSFAIGLEGSPDLAASQKVADVIGTVHHQLTYTIQEGIDALSDVIRHIETYDVTTVRASTPMVLMARRIKSYGIKMVLSGEGADEVFGGYLYFHKAPDAEALHGETVRKLHALHQFDCLRANKSMAAWGVEARVPFLDHEFLKLAMHVDPARKLCRDGRMEKHILREAFQGWLPDEVLWRQKEQFSDGVGYSWIDSLQELAEVEVTDRELERAADRFPIQPPLTKEGYLYRSLFEEHFPSATEARTVPEGKSIACSSPVALEWDAEFAAAADPSGRAVQDVHEGAKLKGH